MGSAWLVLWVLLRGPLDAGASAQEPPPTSAPTPPEEQTTAPPEPTPAPTPTPLPAPTPTPPPAPTPTPPPTPATAATAPEVPDEAPAPASSAPGDAFGDDGGGAVKLGRMTFRMLIQTRYTSTWPHDVDEAAATMVEK